MTETAYSLVGDIGGTNARFALVRRGSHQVEQVQVLESGAYANLDAAVSRYLGDVGVNSIEDACVAFAGPVQREELKLTNSHWRFTRADMKARLGLRTFKVINDFTAMALSVPHVTGAHLVAVGQESTGLEQAPRLVIGPGTGLGVAGLIWVRGGWVPLASEGGHVDFAATTDLEIEILRRLRPQFGRVSAERLLCGAGLVSLYQTLCDIRGVAPVESTPGGVTQAALRGEDPVAKDTLWHFCEIFGRVAGNAALTLGAQGGVYICGGIIPRFIEFFRRSPFLESFQDKGRMRDLLQGIPIYVVTHPHAGLLGAAEALTNADV